MNLTGFNEAVVGAISREMNRLTLRLLASNPEWRIIPANAVLGLITQQKGVETREATLRGMLDRLRCIKEMFNPKGPYIMSYAPEGNDGNIYFTTDDKRCAVHTSGENEVTVAFWVLER